MICAPGTNPPRSKPLLKALLFGLLLAVVLAASLMTTARPAQAAEEFKVTKTADTADGSCSSTDCSLREAIIAANNSTGVDTVAVPAGSYTLSAGAFDTGGDLDITDGVTIIGAGARTTTISGGNTSRVFEVGADNTDPTVSISGVTIADGRASDSVGFDGAVGAGIYNSGTLTLTKSTVSNNRADADGGGILNEAGASLTVNSSTLRGNQASQGGAISNRTNNSAGDGLVTLTNSTLSGNKALGSFSAGGAIETRSQTASVNMTIQNTTIAFNTTDGVGAGIFEGGFGAISFQNTIVAKNTLVNLASDNCRFPSGSDSQGNNLDSDGSCDFDQQSDKESVDPKLGVLKNNGGPTDTHALLKGSPALNAGGTSFPPQDQRGIKRPQGKASDIGAYEKKKRRR